jgi:hypothetical protein
MGGSQDVMFGGRLGVKTSSGAIFPMRMEAVNPFQFAFSPHLYKLSDGDDVRKREIIVSKANVLLFSEKPLRPNDGSTVAIDHHSSCTGVTCVHCNKEVMNLIVCILDYRISIGMDVVAVWPSTDVLSGKCWRHSLLYAIWMETCVQT